MSLFGKLLRSQFGWALIAGAAIGTAGTAVFLHTRTAALADPLQNTVLTGVELNTLEALDAAGTKLVEQVAPSVVLIKGARGEGSGVVYSSDGYIMTNAHVVAGSRQVTVEFHDGRSEQGNVLRDTQDSLNDIAIIKVNRKDLKAARFADSGTVRPGQIAVAIGAPFGLAESVSFGHVSALGRQNLIPDRESREGVRAYFNMIQTDAAINPGNSGGPLLNYKGEVIGINTAINTMTGSSSGVGFAIPANTAKIIADQLIKDGKISRAYLGIVPGDLKGFEVDELGVKSGAIVRNLPEKDSPAKDAGIKEGDIIVEIAGKQIRGEQDLRDAMLLTQTGKSISVKAIRSGKVMTFNVKPTSRPADLMQPQPQPQMPDSEFNFPFDFGAPEAPDMQPEPPVKNQPELAGPVKLGVQVRALQAGEKEQAPGGSGVMVVTVEPGSVAAKAGVKPGVVITQIGDAKVASPEDLRSAIAKFKPGDTTILSYGRYSNGMAMRMSTTIKF